LDNKGFYDKKYGSFDSLRGYVHEKEYCDRIINWMKKNKHWPDHEGSYLDAGCGFGLKTYLFSSYFQNSMGIDFSEKVIDICKLLNDHPGKLDFQPLDIESFSGKSFDLVTAFGLSYFNTNEVVELSSRLANMSARLLKSKGILLVATRKGPGNSSMTGWHNLTNAQIVHLHTLLGQSLPGSSVTIVAPDEKFKYLYSGSMLQVAGSLRKIILNKSRDLFILIKNG
jgi:SAM-dependent methyltransferase